MNAPPVEYCEKTKVQNLVRHKSGRHYARMFRNGREVWKSLRTTHFSVALAKLASAMKVHREQGGRVKLTPRTVK